LRTRARERVGDRKGRETEARDTYVYTHMCRFIYIYIQENTHTHTHTHTQRAQKKETFDIRARKMRKILKSMGVYGCADVSTKSVQQAVSYHRIFTHRLGGERGHAGGRAAELHRARGVGAEGDGRGCHKARGHL
jgi:hypothetical protein